MTASYTVLATCMYDTVTAFRLGMEGQANESFAQLIDALGEALPNTPKNNMPALSLLLPEILAAQNRQDYLNIADLLEYQLAPLLALD